MRSNHLYIPLFVQKYLLALVLLAGGPVMAQEQAISLTLGDYRFTPETLEVNAGQPVVLTLTNTDGITPHDFVMDDAAAGLDLEVSVSAGKSKTIEFTPTTPGSYTFYCSKKLPFMKSHRKKGMEGTLIVK